MKTYLRHRIFNVVEVKELIALEYLDFEGKYKDYSEHHNFWELCYVCDGEVRVMLDGGEFVLRGGELILISPNSVHSYFSNVGNATRAFVICFESSSSVLRALDKSRFSLDKFGQICIETVIEESKNTFCMNEEEHLEVLKDPNFGGQQVIIIQLEYLFIRLLRELAYRKNSEVVFLSEENFYIDISNDITSFFEEHIRENITLDDVCKKMNYSRAFLCRIFKEQTGETLIGCFNRMRMRTAARLLAETDWSVMKVASYLGFAEAKYFGVIFKRHIGVPPTEYRKTLSDDQEKKDTEE